MFCTRFLTNTNSNHRGQTFFVTRPNWKKQRFLHCLYSRRQWEQFACLIGCTRHWSTTSTNVSTDRLPLIEHLLSGDQHSKEIQSPKKRQLTFINQAVLLDKGFCNDSSRRIDRVDRCQQPTVSTANTNYSQLFNNKHLPKLPLQKYRTKSDSIQAHIRRCNSTTISHRLHFHSLVHRFIHRSSQLSH